MCINEPNLQGFNPFSSADEQYPALPAESIFRDILVNNHHQFPEILPEEIEDIKQNLGVEYIDVHLINSPEANDIYSVWIRELAKTFGIPAPKLYWAKNDHLFALSCSKSGSIILGCNHDNLFNPEVIVGILSHEFAHGLLPKKPNNISSEQMHRREKFCDGFASVFRANNFPAPRYYLSFSTLIRDVLPQPTENRISAFSNIISRRTEPHPTLGQRMAESLRPLTDKETSALETAKGLGFPYYAKALLKHAISRCQHNSWLNITFANPQPLGRQ